MDVFAYLAALLMAAGAHTGGHMDLAHRMGMNPAYVDYRTMSERVPAWVSNPRTEQERRAATTWHGAGFEGQDAFKQSINDPDDRDRYRLMSGLYKLGYSLLGPQGSYAGEGDVGSMKRISRNKFVVPLLSVSALNDMYRGSTGEKLAPWMPDEIDFSTFEQGTPGLKFSWDW